MSAALTPDEQRAITRAANCICDTCLGLILFFGPALIVIASYGR